MSVILIDEPPGAAAGEPTRHSFWQRLARIVDRHFADRSRRAVSPLTLRRSKYDVDRCRRLLGKSGLAPAGASYATISHRRASCKCDRQICLLGMSKASARMLP